MKSVIFALVAAAALAACGKKETAPTPAPVAAPAPAEAAVPAPAEAAVPAPVAAPAAEPAKK